MGYNDLRYNKKIRIFGDPVLKEMSKAAELSDEGLKDLVSEMLLSLREADGVGLAAPQIGVLKRVIVMDIGDEDATAFINPEIIWESEEKEEGEEGCLSLPHIHLPVERSTSVKVRARSMADEEISIDAEGLLARVFQHEIDHLDGRLIIDRTSKGERIRALRELGLLPR